MSEIYNITGSVSVSAGRKEGVKPNLANATPYLSASALTSQNSFNYTRAYQKSLYNRLITGQAKKSEVGEAGIQTSTATVPTWTQITTGVNHSFVSSVLSASRHEVTNLNAYYSGTVMKESSPVPFSGSEYYSKNNLVHKIYKLTASALLNPGLYVFTASVTGNLINTSSISSPAEFQINVPDTGKLVDIKVWVDLAHLSNSAYFPPLDALAVSLQSPNVRWKNGHAHPIRNDEMYIKETTSSLHEPESFYDCTYILWEGALHATSLFEWETTKERYATWGKDRGMRTIFSDSSKQFNPRHLERLGYDGVPQSVSGNYLNSPAYACGAGNTAYGNNGIWYSDQAAFAGSAYAAVGSAPNGWRTGPAGTTDVNEVNSTGSNYGPNDIKPLYPLLDDIYAAKLEIHDPPNNILTLSPLSPLGVVPATSNVKYAGFNKWRGFRPGLRGSEIKGTWTLKIVTTNGQNSQDAPLYFRQFRLELIYETGVKNNVPRARRKGNHGFRPGERICHIISGSGESLRAGSSSPEPDHFKTAIYTSIPEDVSISKTFGITNDVSALSSLGFAVFTRLTGALAVASGSSIERNFLDNEFGTPYIPLSSGSGETMVSELLQTFENDNSNTISTILSPKNLVGSAQTAKSALSGHNVTATTRDLIAEITSGSA